MYSPDFVGWAWSLRPSRVYHSALPSHAGEGPGVGSVTISRMPVWSLASPKLSEKARTALGDEGVPAVRPLFSR